MSVDLTAEVARLEAECNAKLALLHPLEDADVAVGEILPLGWQWQIVTPLRGPRTVKLTSYSQPDNRISGEYADDNGIIRTTFLQERLS